MLNKFTRADAKKYIPQRKITDNKTAGGNTLIIAGSEGMFGAAVLAATAAARVGSGYVTLLMGKNKFNVCRHPDFITADPRKIKISEARFSAVAIGPGLGRSTRTKTLLKKVINSKIHPVVIDADALDIYARFFSQKLPKTWIATPHEGELARLLGVADSVVKKDRAAAVRKAQKKMGCIVLLKGHKTLVATTDSIVEIQAGNKALAKAGTGDVLTGIIAGLLAQGCAPDRAACLGAFLHGFIADEWINARNDYLSLMASDLLNALPKALQKIRKGNRK